MLTWVLSQTNGNITHLPIITMYFFSVSSVGDSKSQIKQRKRKAASFQTVSQLHKVEMKKAVKTEAESG